LVFRRHFATGAFFIWWIPVEGEIVH
jgi:hypothetical protein